MHITEAMKIAFLSLWANKLRSPLLSSAWSSEWRRDCGGHVRQRYQWLRGGEDPQPGCGRVHHVQGSPATTNIDHYLEAMKRKDLNMDDYRAVREGCKLCSYVGAYAFKLTGHVKYGEKSLSDTMVWGMTPAVGGDAGHRYPMRPHVRRIGIWNMTRRGRSRSDIVDNLMPGVDPWERKYGWMDGCTESSGLGKRRARR